MLIGSFLQEEQTISNSRLKLGDSMHDLVVVDGYSALFPFGFDDLALGHVQKSATLVVGVAVER